MQGRHWRGARAQARLGPYNGGAPPLPPLPSIFQNRGKAAALPALPGTAPLELLCFWPLGNIN